MPVTAVSEAAETSGSQQRRDSYVDIVRRRLVKVRQASSHLDFLPASSLGNSERSLLGDRPFSGQKGNFAAIFMRGAR
jgi:hypothetical protein